MGPGDHGAREPWGQGTMGPWSHGGMGPWVHGAMGFMATWDHGKIGPWGKGAIGPRDSRPRVGVNSIVMVIAGTITSTIVSGSVIVLVNFGIPCPSASLATFAPRAPRPSCPAVVLRVAMIVVLLQGGLQQCSMETAIGQATRGRWLDCGGMAPMVAGVPESFN